MQPRIEDQLLVLGNSFGKQGAQLQQSEKSARDMETAKTTWHLV